MRTDLQIGLSGNTNLHSGVVMSNSFSHTLVERQPNLLSRSGLQYGMLPSSAHPEHRHLLSGDSFPHTMPLLLYPTSVDAGFYEGPYGGASPFFSYLPAFRGHLGLYECPFEPAFIQKRNERERQRVKCVNQGYAKLRDHLPAAAGDRRLSKVETLRAAIRYIKHLQALVSQLPPGEPACKGPVCRPLHLGDPGHSDAESGSSSPGLYCGESEGSGS